MPTTTIHLGRDTAATVRAVAKAGHVLKAAPVVYRGPLPQQSPNLFNYTNKRYRGQEIGCCFPSGTMIRMADGTERPIESIRQGERVVTHNHGSRQVLRSFRRPYTGDIVTLRAARNPREITATADHRFATPLRHLQAISWDEIGSIGIGEEVLSSRQPAGDPVKDIDVLDYVPGYLPCTVRSSVRMAVVDLPVYCLEVEEDHSFVANGYVVHNCVGEMMAAIGETSAKTPEPFQDGSPALPEVAFSQLFAYWLARQMSAQLGVNLGGEGAIVSHAFKALAEGLASGVKGGYREYNLWPATDATYAAYRDSRPVQAALSGTSIPLRGPALMLTYPEQILEYLAIGQPVGVGTPWTGSMQTAADGRIAWGGSMVGGHAYQIVAYDLKANRIYGTNSWDNARYGVQPGGLFYTNLTSWLGMFTTRTMASGECEAMVIDNVGIQQAAGDWADAWGGRP